MFKRALILALGLLAPVFVWASPSVEIETSYGKIILTLHHKKAPETVDNFLEYTRSGFYNGTIFHRVIPGFMIQGGGFTPDMAQKATRKPIKNEAGKSGLKNRRGSIAMARTSDPHSATAQFFINLVDNPSLDYSSSDGWGYAVFGEVTDGLEVIDRIAEVETGDQAGHGNVPRQPIIIKTIRILSEK